MDVDIPEGLMDSFDANNDQQSGGFLNTSDEVFALTTDENLSFDEETFLRTLLQPETNQHDHISQLDYSLLNTSYTLDSNNPTTSTAAPTSYFTQINSPLTAQNIKCKFVTRVLSPKERQFQPVELPRPILSPLRPTKLLHRNALSLISPISSPAPSLDESEPASPLSSSSTPSSPSQESLSDGKKRRKSQKRGSYKCGKCGLPKKGHTCTPSEDQEGEEKPTTKTKKSRQVVDSDGEFNDENKPNGTRGLFDSLSPLKSPSLALTFSPISPATPSRLADPVQRRRSPRRLYT